MESAPRTTARRRTRVRGALAALALVAAAAGLTIACGDSAADETPTPAVLATSAPPAVRASTGILVDRATGYVLWRKSPDTRRQPASLTKVMAAIIVLEKVKNLNSWCTAPRAVAQELGNVIGLRPGDRITVRQALTATIVKSANDACLTLAYKVAGSEQAFVKLMNAKARSLGLDDTYYKNSRGKPVAGHYMSADDLARLGRYVMRNATFRTLCSTQTATVTWPGHSVPIKSRNRLLNYEWGYGIKTGATPESGKCLLGAGTFSLRPLILVTMNEPTRDQEEKDAVALFAWGDAQYEQRQLVEAGGLVTTVPLSGGGEVRAVAATELAAVVRRAAAVQATITLVAQRLDRVPEPGAKLGTVTYKADGQKLGTVDLVADGLVQPSPSPSSSSTAP